MKNCFLVLALALSASASFAQSAWSDKTRVLPDKLRQVPVGITLWHTPNPNYPQPDSAQAGHYVWKHQTMVRSEVADLQVVECGSFIWYDQQGWKANMRETPEEFAQLFHCPKAELRAGTTYTFAKNYRYATSAKSLYGGDALWYVLAKDKNGNLYKGMGLVETEANVR
ncbi:hypothetical protein [Hymenobacter sp. BT491]|uniref:hypothetical protein n=1 Tax=Hymenobacter sp. BT491 TaxID=2766779 RepID=UPI001653E5D7|nr:hypothetical protein [Hymenobacter sp. BT491]MBC6990390.1 hypothetical protein [Hymenobacter sp. BT491]